MMGAIQLFTGILSKIPEAASLFARVKPSAKQGGIASVVQKTVPKEGNGETDAKLPWTSFENYPKVTIEGREYAVIGGKLYTEHAVQRMLPSSLDSNGRSISPTYVDYILKTAKPAYVVVNGVVRQVYASGSVQVVTENGIIVTVNPFRY